MYYINHRDVMPVEATISSISYKYMLKSCISDIHCYFSLTATFSCFFTFLNLVPPHGQLYMWICPQELKQKQIILVLCNVCVSIETTVKTNRCSRNLQIISEDD